MQTQRMENVCRVCLDGSVTLVDIFADNAAYVLQQCCKNYTVQRGDAMSQYICLSCIQAAQNAYRFKLLLEQSMENYRQLTIKKTKKPPAAATTRCHLVLAKVSDNEETYTITNSDEEEDLMRANESKEMETEHEVAVPADKLDDLVEHYIYDEFRKCIIFPSEINEKDPMAEMQTETVLTFNIGTDDAVEEDTCILRNPLTEFADRQARMKMSVEMEQIPELAQVPESTLKNVILENDTTKEEARICKKKKMHETETTDRQHFNKEDSPDVMELLMSISTDTEKGETDTQSKLIPFECRWCSKVISREENIKWHELRQCGKVSYVCQVCGNAYMTKFQLSRHTSCHNNKQTSKRKPLGNKNTPSPKKKKPEDSHKNDRQDRKESISPRKNRSTEEFPCPECNKRFDSKEKLDFHMNEMCHKCPQCSRFYANKRSLMRHLKDHNTLELFDCRRCPRSFTEIDDFLVHKNTHKNDGPFNCIQCNAEFNDVIYLQIHAKLEHSQEVTEPSKLKQSQGDTGATPRSSTKRNKSDHHQEQGQLERSQNDTLASKLERSQGDTEELKLEHSQGDTGATPRRARKQIKSDRHQEQEQLERNQKDTSPSKLERSQGDTGATPRSARKQIKSDRHQEQGQLERSQEVTRGSPCGARKQLKSKQIDSEMLSPSLSRSPSLPKKMKCGDDTDDTDDTDTLSHTKSPSLPKKLNFACKKCDEKFTSVTSLSAHTHTHSDVGCPHHECTFCKKTFISAQKFQLKRSLDSHSLVHTIGDRPFACSHCSKTFLSKYDLNEHACTHSAARPYECTQCDKKYTSKQNLDRHLLFHAGKLPYKCSNCGKKFVSKHELIGHALTHSDSRPYKCLICEMPFKTKYSLQRHGLVHSGKRPHECLDCGKKYSRKNSLDRHRLLHITLVRPFACSHCDMKFLRKDELNGHVRKHSDERPYECTQCHKKFKANQSLIRHTQIHTGERPYECSQCDKKFAKKYDLKEHTLIHIGECNFKCSDCGLKFLRRRDLVAHAVIHTGERPYKCLACNKKFRSKYFLESHTSKYTDKGPYNCRLCGIKFEQGCVLNQHVTLTHESHECLPCDRKFSSIADLDEHMRGRKFQTGDAQNGGV